MHLEDGDDGVGFGSTIPAIAVEVYGGDGKDNLKGYGATNALLDGGAGNDVIKGWQTDETLRGGPGDDEIDGSGGNDRVEGGDGNDTLRPDTYYGPGNDYVDGGAGFDLIDDYTIPDADYHPPVSLTMDGAANDGRPGEADNVINVEKTESHVSGTLVGGDLDDDFRVFANLDEGNSTMVGNGGNDKLIAGDYTDSLDGGAGNDMLNGGYGNDTITGGPGQDTIQGDATSTTCGYWSYTCKIPFGNDVINARDGEADNVDCGVGTDQAIVDAIDVVANCETTDAAAAPSPGAGPGAASPKFSHRTIGKKKLTVTVPCAGACKVSATLTVKGKKLATGRKTLLKAGDAKLTLKFAKPRRNVTATLKVTVESADGEDERLEVGEAGEARPAHRAGIQKRGPRVAASLTVMDIATSRSGHDPLFDPGHRDRRIRPSATWRRRRRCTPPCSASRRRPTRSTTSASRPRASRSGSCRAADPQGMTSPVAYWHVADIEAKLAKVTAGVPP